MPTVGLDVPITAIYLVLFVCSAATHMFIIQNNRQKSHKFLLSNMLFGFSMSRIVACTLRIVLATKPHNVRLAIAAQIFIAAGVIILFVVNLIFTHRILRASHPNWGWNKVFSTGYKMYYVSVIIMLIALITCTIQSFSTVSQNTKRIDRDVQLVGTTYFAVASFMPIPMMLLNLLIPRSGPVDKFGEGRYRTKIGLLFFTATLLCLGASFRAGTLYFIRPKSDPAAFQSKACFYIFDFTIEIIVLFTYAFIRVDRRFHIPNGASGHGSYALNFRTEEEVFDDEVTDVESNAQGSLQGHSVKTEGVQMEQV